MIRHLRSFFHPRNSIAALLLYCGLLTVTSPVLADVARLVNVQPVVLPGNQIQVRFDFTLPPPLPQNYRVAQPNSLVLDFWGVENDTTRKRYQVLAGALRSIELAQDEGRLRATVNTTQALPYRLFADGNSLFLELRPTLPHGLGPLTPDVRKVAGDRPPELAPGQLLGMEFEQLGETGRVMLTLSDDRAGLDILEEGNNVVVNLLGASLSPAFEKRLDVQHYGTPLLFLDAFASDGNAAVLVKPGADPYRFSAWQLGRQVTLEFRPLHLVKPAAGEGQPHLDTYAGLPMTVNLQNVNVRAVLQMIAETAGRQLVVSDRVAGEISLRLRNVPWQKALALVTERLQLEARPLGDVLFILARGETANPRADISEAYGRGIVPEMMVAGGDVAAPAVDVSRRTIPPVSIRTEMLPVRNLQASGLRQRLLEAGLLSPRGKLQADDSAGLLVLSDTDIARGRVRAALRKLDVLEYRSVMLETWLVAAPKDVATRLGVNWSQVAPQRQGMQIGFRPARTVLDVELQQLQRQGTARVLSHSLQRLKSGEEVNVERGRELTPLIGRRPDHYQDVVMSVDVMSRIQPEGRIMMNVNIIRDILSQNAPDGQISIANNELVSSVVVPDGDALVLSGFLAQERQRKAGQRRAHSLLGNSPDNTENSDQDMELLIFITPVLAGSI